MTTQTQEINKKSTGGNDRQPEMSAANKKKNSVLSYVLLPGIIPEIKELSRSKFGYLAYLIALIYQIVRILPKNHPYTKPSNIGNFNVLKVIAAAADHITLDRQNIDQIVIFVAILAGLILMILQFVSFIIFLFMGNAWAGAGIPAESASLFTTASPDTDIAFIMIREVFGLPTMFGTLSEQTGLHSALHKLFEFYNLAMLFVAVLIFLYYIIVVVGETAQTGAPFGQRFNKIYAPFRLVIAIGLLVPLNYGFNGAQYLAFYAAKTGSSLATNGWIRFNTVLEDSNPLGVENKNLIAQPTVPDLTGLVEAMSLFVTCREAYELKRRKPTTDPYADNKLIQAYIVNSKKKPIIINANADLDTIQNEFIAAQKKGHISIYFGEIGDGKKPTDYPGNSTPYCGKIKVSLQVSDQTSLNAVGDASPNKIQYNYFFMVLFLWTNNVELAKLGQRIARAHDTNTGACKITGLPGNCVIDVKPDSAFKKKIIAETNGVFKVLTDNVFDALRKQVNYKMDPKILKAGWGGAGIWYNKIAQANGAFVTATMSIPNIQKRPMVMETVAKAKQKSEGAISPCKEYDPNLADNKKVHHKGGRGDAYYASVLNETYQYWRCDRSESTANVVWDTISAVFGLNGLFNIRDKKYIDGDGNTIRTRIHPLAKLSTIGKSLVDSAVANMGLAMASSFGGGMLGVLLPHVGAAFDAASGMFVSIATVGLSIGFVLFYILPILPFIYFFFAVGGWVKGLFEAMVGAPLWALAHLRIDGDGLPGKSAMSGYLLIFEIFLRPILTVFGLIGGLAIFTAMASILDEIFDLVVTNVTGAEEVVANDDGAAAGSDTFGRHLIDQFFFTIVYAIILYMMAISSFKMITLVPNHILRWLGQSVAAFNDQSDDAASGLTQYAAIGGAKIGGQLAGGMTQLSRGAGSLIGEGGGLIAGRGVKPS